jgi:hypothetical protein
MVKVLGETFSIKVKKLRTQGTRLKNKPKYIKFLQSVIFVKRIPCVLNFL